MPSVCRRDILVMLVRMNVHVGVDYTVMLSFSFHNKQFEAEIQGVETGREKVGER